MLASAKGHARLDANDDVLRIVRLEPFRHHLNALAIVQHVVMFLPGFGPVLVSNARFLPLGVGVDGCKLRVHLRHEGVALRLPAVVHFKVAAYFERLARKNLLGKFVGVPVVALHMLENGLGIVHHRAIREIGVKNGRHRLQSPAVRQHTSYFHPIQYHHLNFYSQDANVLIIYGYTVILSKSLAVVIGFSQKFTVPP